MASVTATKLGASGTVNVPEELFGQKFHGPLVHEVVTAELAARRRGTASTKNRKAVRGGGVKPWRQKGTGRARIGSIRAPHWTGGGVTFGPTPRSYTVKVNRKARRKAIKSVLSLHAERGSLAVLDSGSLTEASTKTAADLLKKWGNPSSVLVVCGHEETSCYKSFRNIARATVGSVDTFSVADAVNAHSLVLTSSALEELPAKVGEK